MALYLSGTRYNLNEQRTNRKSLINQIKKNIDNARKVLTAYDFATFNSWWYLDSLKGLPRPAESIENAETLLSKLKEDNSREFSTSYKALERLFERIDKTGTIKNIQKNLTQKVYDIQKSHEETALENTISRLKKWNSR